jgi:hypothetical protein
VAQSSTQLGWVSLTCGSTKYLIQGVTAASTNQGGVALSLNPRHTSTALLG